MSIILSLSIYICSKFATLCCNVISLFITNYILHQSFYVHHLITLLFPFLLFSHLSKICYIFHSCFCNTIFFFFIFILYDTLHTWSRRSGIGLARQLLRLRLGGGTGTSGGGCCDCFGGNGGRKFPKSTRYFIMEVNNESI